MSTRDGKLLWGTRLEQHLAALVTQSPVVYAGNVYVGISSLEELIADNPTYNCCTFISSFVKVSASTGKVLWRTYMAPPNGGKTGGFSGVCRPSGKAGKPTSDETCTLPWLTGLHTARASCSGNSIWGSSPAIDRQRNQVYIATGGPCAAECARPCMPTAPLILIHRVHTLTRTGNNYEVPANLTRCLQRIGNLSDPTTLSRQLQCEARFGARNYRNT